MRTAFVETLLDLAAADDRIFLVTGDLGWSVLEGFAARHPRRFLNVGVAEANMVGVATGLALEGFLPFVYSIATFSSMRCYEQIRNGPLLHRVPVRIVGIGGGYAYGHAGPTHYALEDIVIARAQPGLTVVVPADAAQTRAAVRATLDLPGPVYLRLGKGGNADLPGLGGRFALDRPEIVRGGERPLFLTCGSIVQEVVAAAGALDSEGIAAGVAVMAHVGFVAGPALVDLLAKAPAVLTVEEGYLAGGLGSLVAETIARHRLSCRLETVGVRSPHSGVSGSERYMRTQAGLDAASLAETARRMVASLP